MYVRVQVHWLFELSLDKKRETRAVENGIALHRLLATRRETINRRRPMDTGLLTRSLLPTRVSYVILIIRNLITKLALIEHWRNYLISVFIQLF